MTMFWTILFCATCAALIYVVAGYPLLLDLLARFKARPVQKDEVLRSVSIVIAVRNGEQFLAEKLDSILALDYPRELMEIHVVSDGSDDRTDEIASLYADQGVRAWRIPRSGKAAALNLGVSRSTNEILVLTDVRQRLAPDSLRKLIACFGDPEVGAVSGELSILRGDTNEEADTGLYWKYEVWMRKGMSRLHSTFGTNGPFYAMRRSLAVHIPQDTLLDDVYLPIAGLFKGFRIILEPSARAFDYPTNLSSELKRKIRTQAGLYQTIRFYPELFTRANPMRFHFLSGKFARLMLPWLLLALAVSSFGLPMPFSVAAITLQLAFYTVALLDFLVPEELAVKRITSPIRTFVALVIAALLGARIFFVPPRELWKETQVRKVSG